MSQLSSRILVKGKYWCVLNHHNIFCCMPFHSKHAAYLCRNRLGGKEKGYYCSIREVLL